MAQRRPAGERRDSVRKQCKESPAEVVERDSRSRIRRGPAPTSRPGAAFGAELMHSLPHATTSPCSIFGVWSPPDVGLIMATAPPAWTDLELDESILKLCEEFPDLKMAACSRVVEYCRQMTPRGSPAALLTAMRGALQQQATTDTINRAT